MTNENTVSAPAEEVTFKKQGQVKEIFRRLRKSPGAMVGLVLLILLLLIVVFADQIAPYEKAIQQDVFNKLQPPSAEHIMGTDTFGRDVLARLVHGGRTSLTIALLASITSCIFGSLLGAIAGYFGGKVDMLIMRALDIFMSIPDLLFTMVVVAALGASIPVLIVAMTLAYFTNYVRLVRSGSRRMMVSARVVLPAPVSPTRPRVCPFLREKLTPLTAYTVSRSVL